MVLNDISVDCKILSDFFKEISYFTDLLELYKQTIEPHCNNTILIPVSEQKYYMDTVYDLAENVHNYSWNIATTTQKFLSSCQFHSDTLNEKLRIFLNCIEEFMLLSAKFNVYKNTPKHYSYASSLYSKLEKTYNCYITLYSNVSFFKSIMSELYNEVPEQIQDNPDYIELNIQSNKETSILPEDISKNYYIQKVESGSIFFSIVAASPFIIAIVKTIDYCASIYYKHKNNHIALKIAENELEKAQIMTNLLKQYQEQGLNIENNGEKLEQIEKIFTTTMKYLSSNPSGKLNDKDYGIQTEPTLLTNRNLQETITNEPESSTDE